LLSSRLSLQDLLVSIAVGQSMDVFFQFTSLRQLLKFGTPPLSRTVLWVSEEPGLMSSSWSAGDTCFSTKYVKLLGCCLGEALLFGVTGTLTTSSKTLQSVNTIKETRRGLGNAFWEWDGVHRDLQSNRILKFFPIPSEGVISFEGDFKVEQKANGCKWSFGIDLKPTSVLLTKGGQFEQLHVCWAS